MCLANFELTKVMVARHGGQMMTWQKVRPPHPTHTTTLLVSNVQVAFGVVV